MKTGFSLSIVFLLTSLGGFISGAACQVRSIADDTKVFSEKIKQVAVKRDYARLEDLAHRYRTTEKDTTWGWPALNSFYQSFDQLTLPASESVLVMEDFLAGWRKEFPDSLTEKVVRARYLSKQGWTVHDEAMDKDQPEARKIWAARSAQVWDLLLPLLPRAAEDGEICAVLIHNAPGLVADHQASRTRVNPILETCVTQASTYAPIYQRAAYYLSPSWYGVAGELEEFVSKSAFRLGAQGDICYARTVFLIRQHMGNRFKNQLRFNPLRVAKGFAQLQKQYSQYPVFSHRALFVLHEMGEDQAATEFLPRAKQYWDSECDSIWGRREDFSKLTALLESEMSVPTEGAPDPGNL